MKLLFDTHALIWWIGGDDRMRQRDTILDARNVKYVSAVSAVEIATKFRIGKLPEAEMLATSFEAIIAEQGFEPLPLSLTHGRLAGRLPGSHGDPFDRMIAAQAQFEGMVLLSADRTLDQFGVQRLW